MDEQKRTFRIVIIINTIFFLSLFFLIVPIIFIAVSLSGAPGNDTKIFNKLLSNTAMLYPLVVIISILLTWISYKLKFYKISIISSLLPLLNFIIFAIIFILTIITNNPIF